MPAESRGRFASQARRAAAPLRVALGTRADLEAVALRLGVRVRTQLISESIQGLTVSRDEIILHRGLTETERRYVLAHELGHVLVRRGRLTFRNRRAEECFADAFARELLLPAGDVLQRRDSTIPTLCRRYGVSRSVAALQMAEAGLAPSLMRDRDGSVLCVSCGDRQSMSECACLRYRQNPTLVAAQVE